jgi:hypothetical protein
MKFCAQLPESKHFKSLPVPPDKDYFLFEDKATSAIRIKSPIANPFGKTWGLALQHQKQKSDIAPFPYRLVIKLVNPDPDAIPCDLERRMEKGVYTYTREAPLVFVAVPVPLETGIYSFLTYSLYSKV